MYVDAYEHLVDSLGASIQYVIVEKYNIRTNELKGGFLIFIDNYSEPRAKPLSTITCTCSLL